MCKSPSDGGGGTCGPSGGLPEFHLHVDADRDGTVDADRTGLDAWHWGAGQKGAIVFCNNDDDQGASATDNSDAKVNAGNDGTELAPIEIRRTGPAPPADWEGSLEVSLADSQRIHIFEDKSAGSPVVMGQGKGNSFTLPNLNFTTKQLWMEATQYADSAFPGEITLTFKLKKGGVLCEEEHAKFRVAPWIMPNHLDTALKVFVVQTAFVPTPGGMADNSRFRGELNTFVSGAGCSLQTKVQNDDVWMQDCMEIGFSNFPPTGFHAVLRASRENFVEDPPGSGVFVGTRPLKNFPKTLLAADFGYQEEGPALTTPHQSATFDSTGNLECTPPFTSGAGKKYPWGRIYFGPGRAGEPFNPDVKDFLKKQVVQDPIEIDTGWLLVGHVDEMISFVPGGAKGFTLLLASPKLGYKILNDNKAKHGSEKMLLGRTFPDEHFDPTTGLPVAWHNAEVTIKDFLDSGLTGVKSRLTATHLKSYNDSLQAKLDATRSKFKAALGLAETDIIDVPSLFADITRLGLADALTAGMVNMLVINKKCLVAKPFGPVVGGKDLFQKDLEGKLTALGLTVQFIDDWFEYHVQLGEVHCATNTLRAPTTAKWWEFTP